MIVRLDKEQQKQARRQLLNDVVYILSHDALRQLQSDGYTSLSPVEVFLSAQKFCDDVLALPDITEGLIDEIEDLEEECEDKNETAMILTVASVQMQALSKRRIGTNFHEVITLILDYLDDNELLMSLVDQMTRKEEARWIEGKKTDLLNYELICIEEEGGLDAQEVVASIVEEASGLSSDAMLPVETTLARINDKFGHIFQEDLNRLREALQKKSESKINIEKVNDIYGNSNVTIGGI